MQINRLCLLAALVLSFLWSAKAETGYEAWLRYVPAEGTQKPSALDLGEIAMLSSSPIVKSAAEELSRGIRGMFGLRTRQVTELPQDSAIVLTTMDELRKNFPNLPATPILV